MPTQLNASTLPPPLHVWSLAVLERAHKHNLSSAFTAPLFTQSCRYYAFLCKICRVPSPTPLALARHECAGKDKERLRRPIKTSVKARRYSQFEGTYSMTRDQDIVQLWNYI